MMKKAIYVGIIFIILASGAYVAYKQVEALNIARCLGCLAMEPKTKAFEDFWVEYPSFYTRSGIPEHPSWLVNESRQHVTMLFFWFEGCSACKSQWERMKKYGLVEGGEADGKFTENFSYAKLITIDIINSPQRDALKIYQTEGRMEAPTTVIIFEKNDTIYWYAFSGDANGEGGRPDVETLVKILERAEEEKNGGVQP